MTPAPGRWTGAALAVVAIAAVLQATAAAAQATAGLGATEDVEVHARPVLETASDLGARAEVLTVDAGVARAVSESLTLAFEGRTLAEPRAEVGRSAAGVVSIGDPLQVWVELRATF